MISFGIFILKVNFGDVKIPYNLDYPKPQKIDSLSGIHGVSSENIVVVDAQTLLIPGFSYDGEAPGHYDNSIDIKQLISHFSQ